MPLVSVIIPTHNRSASLKEALKSVQAQTFTDYEILVVSSNEQYETFSKTISLCNEFNAKFLYVNHGYVSTARNYAVRYAKGVWLAFLDDDDWWHPKKLEKQLQLALASAAGMISCDYEEIDYSGKVLSIQRPRQSIRWWAPPSCVLLGKDIFDRVGGFDEFLYINEDNDLWRRVRWHYTVRQMTEVLVKQQRDQRHQSLVKSSGLAIKFYDLYHLLKMQFDTPLELRNTLPPLWRILIPIRSILARVSGINYLIRYFGLKTIEKRISGFLRHK